MTWWDSATKNEIKIKAEIAHGRGNSFYVNEWELTAKGECDLIVVDNIDGSFYFDFWSANGFNNCKLIFRNKYKQLNSSGNVVFEKDWSEQEYNLSSNTQTINYNNMNSYVNDSTQSGEGEYQTFSSFLSNFTEENYNNFLTERPLKYNSHRVSNLISLSQNVLAVNSTVENMSGNIFFTKSASNFLNRTTKDYFKEVRKNIVTYSLNDWMDVKNTIVNSQIANTFRFDIIPYLIENFEKYKNGDGKDAFWEGVHTFFDYDGTKKASLIIQHRLDLEEFQQFENETEVYKLPGYAVNIAVNIQTVNPVSGESVNVYNLHKLDYIRDGFTGSPDVDENGLSKKYIYSYGDLIKACNNTVLNLPMKLTVEVLQFDDQKDTPPYVVYENPINPTPDIKEEQHLGIPGTIAYPYVNSLEWRKYPNDDDGENSGGDGKNDDKGDKSGGTGSGQGTHNVLTTTYVSNATRLQALGDFLWSSSFLDNILLVNNNPIENVISVKMFPFTLPTGAESTIVLGNVDTEVPTNKLPDNYNYYHVYGSVKVPSYYNSFMDYAPFTRILLYLPFYGTLELDNSLIIDRSLKIAYIVDVVTGACTIDIYADESLINVISCQVGIDIPITSSNRAQVEAAILTNTLTSAVSGAKVGGGVGAVIGGVGGALMSAGHCKYNTQTSGTPSSATELYNVSVPMLIIDRPKYREIGGFAHNKGKMCMLTKKLRDVSGFSIFDENIDLSGVACTDTEQEIIRNLLKTGIYL